MYINEIKQNIRLEEFPGVLVRCNFSRLEKILYRFKAPALALVVVFFLFGVRRLFREDVFDENYLPEAVQRDRRLLPKMFFMSGEGGGVERVDFCWIMRDSSNDDGFVRS